MTGLATLPRAVWLLGFVSLCNDAASELVYPLVPLYLAGVLMAGPRALGIIEGIAEAVGSLVKLFAGVLADRRRSMKPWVVAGYALAGAARPLFAFASAWPTVAALRFADRLGKGLRAAPRDALLALSIRPEQRGLAFGVHRTMDNLGAVVGPLLAAALLAGGVPLREVFLWATLGGVAAVGLTLAIREPEHPPAAAHPFSWRMAGLSPRFKRYLLVLALFTLGNSSNMFLLLRAREVGVSEAQVPLLWALVAAVAGVLSTPLSALSDRLGRVRLIVAGWTVYGLVYLAFGLAGQTLTIWLLFAAYGLFMAATEGAEKALVADLVPRDRLGTAFGWFNLVAGIMLLPASFFFGSLWEGFGPRAAFAFGTGCALLAALLLVYWVPRAETDGV